LAAYNALWGRAKTRKAEKLGVKVVDQEVWERLIAAGAA
jgi:hypothetical protein